MDKHEADTTKTASRRSKAKAVAFSIMMALAPLPSFADSDAKLYCENQGGRWNNDGCDYSSPDTFDIFGKLIIAILLAGALASAESSK